MEGGRAEPAGISPPTVLPAWSCGRPRFWTRGPPWTSWGASDSSAPSSSGRGRADAGPLPDLPDLSKWNRKAGCASRLCRPWAWAQMDTVRSDLRTRGILSDGTTGGKRSGDVGGAPAGQYTPEV